MQDISDGQKIEIITFEELLKRLKITEDELNAMSIPPFDFLLNSDAIIKNEKTRRLIDRKNNKNKIGKEHVLVYSSKPSSLTIGDLLLEKMQKENNK